MDFLGWIETRIYTDGTDFSDKMKKESTESRFFAGNRFFTRFYHTDSRFLRNLFFDEIIMTITKQSETSASNLIFSNCNVRNIFGLRIQASCKQLEFGMTHIQVVMLNSSAFVVALA